MNISERIHASGKTDKQISMAVGIDVAGVWRWRRGDTTPRIKYLAALARVLDCGVRDLVPEEA